VDVSSGVEVERGVKSEALMREFVAAVRAADAGKSE
jgi:phosphoribosylanthranilate isomerase